MTENCNKDYSLINNLKNGLSPKITYNQYKHLIDVFTTGDFSTESLDNPVGLITYRNLLTEDNILYFTQNTKRTCNIPLGIKKIDKELKTIDLMSRSFKYKHSNKCILENLTKLVICNIMQNYKPSEYKVYYDLNIEGLVNLDNFTLVNEPIDIDKIYNSIVTDRHKKYFNSELYNYRNYRKSFDDRLIVFILTNPSNIKFIESICSEHLKYGIAIINLLESDVSDSSTISLMNTIRPSISKDEFRKEIETYRKMLKEYKYMINEINLLTGEIMSRFEPHEELIVKLPLSEKERLKCENLKSELNNLEKDTDEFYDVKTLIDQIESKYHYSIYNMREYGYQFGGIGAKVDYGSFYHHLLAVRSEIDKEALNYIIKASVYTLFSHSSIKLKNALSGQKDLSDSDKKILNNYVDGQVKYYDLRSDGFDLEYFSERFEEEVDSNITFYNTFFCKVEYKDRNLFVTVNGKEKKLPQSLIEFVDLYRNKINENLLELIIRYELYLEYGVHIPAGIECTFWYTEKGYVKSHQILGEGDFEDSLSCRVNNMIESCNEFKVELREHYSNRRCIGKILEFCYEEKDESIIESLTNYWLSRHDKFKEVISNCIEKKDRERESKNPSMKDSKFFS